MAATPEETLAEEARRRPKAGSAAIAAGVVTMLGALLILAANSDFPTVRLIDVLRVRLGDAPSAEPGPVARKVLYYDDHVVQVVASQVVPNIALALVGVTLVYLVLATRARKPEVSRLALVMAIAGAVLVLLPAVVAAVALTLDVTAFASSSDHSERAARAVLDAPVVAAAYYFIQLGNFALGIAFAFASLNAMRVGLLTRFMGVLGVIVGVLFVVPLEAQLPLVKVFWLLALGALFLGRWPGGPPPAWAAGDARPWPTQQELREARQARQGERGADGLEARERRPRRERAEPPETPAPEPPPVATAPHPSSKKKKRKRR